MSDIFISYSSKDKDKADQLTELLTSAGLSVWIDQAGIDLSSSWSKEIVLAINECKAFIVLLSPSSIASHNVIKEVSLASEKRKKILPLDLEPVQLPEDLEYQLAGIQRAPMSNIDAIIRALGKLGISGTDLTAYPSPDFGLRTSDSGLLRLAVLPFEDLSPSHDNDWFADGMMDELIGTLGSLSKLIVPGRSSVMVYKKDRPKASVIGQELEVRYIVEGTVRKAGEKIRISASLTDAKTNTQLWNNKFDGTFDDIFDFQERVAHEITEGLKLKLTPEDEKKIGQKPTENPEAYELYQKANTYFSRQTKQDFLYALDCLNEAVKLDANFAAAYAYISRVHTELYRNYEHTDFHLTAASEAIEKGQQLNPDLQIIYNALSDLHIQRGEKEEAIQASKKALELEPKNPNSHSQLGFIYSQFWQPEEAARNFEEALRLDPTNLTFHFNLCIEYDRLKNIAKRNQSAERALSYFERHLKKNPDDQNKKMNHAVVLEYLGRAEESLRIIDELISSPIADGAIIYNGACVIARQGEHEKAIAALRKAAKKGFAGLELFRSDPDLDGLRGTAEFEELMKTLEEKNG